jgi:lipoprotein Spr
MKQYLTTEPDLAPLRKMILYQNANGLFGQTTEKTSIENTSQNMIVRIAEIEVFPQYLEEYLTFANEVDRLSIEREPGDNEALYDAINEWMGTPYRYGGTDKNGVDCSGFVGNIYRQVYGRNLHRVANDMQQDAELVSRSQLREGDVVFFTNSKGRVSHVGIYLKNGLFAHSSTSRGVIISRLDDGYWSKHFYKGGRIQ